MLDCLSSIICLPLVRRLGRRAPGRDSQSPLSLVCSSRPTGESIELTRKIPHSPIHTLNDYVLLNIFYLFRLDVSDGLPNFYWGGQRWWYRLAQVCRLWRHLILASPSRLHLHLLCTQGVPIVDMLAHSPPLPLTIYYNEEDRKTTEEDEEGILLALRHSDRVRYIGFYLPAPGLRKVITTMDEQFPIMERLYIRSRTKGDTSLVLPRTFQAPHLRHLGLWGAALPIGSPLLTTTVSLVTLTLRDIPPSAYFPPSNLLTRLSLMPQLEMLVIGFHSPLPNRDVERQLLDTPIMTHITLPNLRVLSFKGVSAYLEGLLARISAPVLSNLEIFLFSQLTFTVPRFLQFMGTSEYLSFSTVWLLFDSDSAESCADTSTGRYHPQPRFSHNQSSEWHNEVGRTQWRQLLRPFNNLKTLYVQGELERAGKLARSLQTDDGEPPLELLPNLNEVGYSGGGNARAFTPFIDERQVAGHPVNLTMVGDSVFYMWQ
ncbi:hypothetical protein BJV78DRAFT_98776 [Lactifluus subvellereus]|nr:hypothetical protein BJV78DRAFT_98776 [Lactifluus subvellereus]